MASHSCDARRLLVLEHRIGRGYKDYETSAFFGIVAPPKTPNAPVGYIGELLTTALRAPEVRAKLVTQGLDLIGTCGEEFRAHIKRQHEKYSRTIKDPGIKTE